MKKPDDVLTATTEDALNALADRSPRGGGLSRAITSILGNISGWRRALEGTNSRGYWREGVEAVLDNPGDYVEG